MDWVKSGMVQMSDMLYFLKAGSWVRNPCNVEMLFKIIKQFGYHGRQGGGVSGVEMALWDLAGKAYGVPCWQLLGGRYRDTIRLYAYVPESISGGTGMDVEKFRADIKHRTEVQGYTWLKFYPSLRHNQPDTRNTCQY